MRANAGDGGLTEVIMTHSPPTTNGARSSGRFTNRTADLEELVVEIQARIDEQIADHGQTSAAIIDEAGRDAVTDTLFARAISNARFQVDHGTRDEQLAAITRVERVQAADEAAEESFLSALLSSLGVHNVDAHQLRRMVHANRAALTDGAPVALDEPAIPAHLLERQHRRDSAANQVRA